VLIKEKRGVIEGQCECVQVSLRCKLASIGGVINTMAEIGVYLGNGERGLALPLPEITGTSVRGVQGKGAMTEFAPVTPWGCFGLLFNKSSNCSKGVMRESPVRLEIRQEVPLLAGMLPREDNKDRLIKR